MAHRSSLAHYSAGYCQHLEQGSCVQLLKSLLPRLLPCFSLGVCMHASVCVCECLCDLSAWVYGYLHFGSSRPLHSARTSTCSTCDVTQQVSRHASVSRMALWALPSCSSRIECIASHFRPRCGDKVTHSKGRRSSFGGGSKMV